MSDVAGKSVLDLLWEQMDQFVDAVQEPVNEDEAVNAKGRAHGMAVAIAVVTNPYAPDVAEVKQAAMDRWFDRVEAEEARLRNERSTLAAKIRSRAERRTRRQERRQSRNS